MLALGIHLEGTSEGLLDTLDAIANELPDARPLLLADALDDGSLTRARTLAEARALELIELSPGGGALALATLISQRNAELWGLLAVGAVVGPGALTRLAAIFDEDPRVGLAGPSTHACWNEQGGHERGESFDEDTPVDARAPELAPLYSLATFCLFVHRRAIDRVGGPDLGYGVGPCWEMDLHVRVARAGLRGAWVRAAFVGRRGNTPLREDRERRHFDASRRRYQDNFCGRRLAGERDRPYAAHCQGDACEYFAPPPLIELRRPSQARIEVEDRPLVSCVVPTVDRLELLEFAVEQFDRQTWPQLELIIVDEGDLPLRALASRDPRVRTLRVAPGTTIGDKRNHAIEHAGGDILVNWDDDDWYGVERVATQVEPLVRGEAEITGLVANLFFQLPRGEFWTPHERRRRQMCYQDVLGGTLAFTREAWARAGGYPAASLAEDAELLRRVLASGGRLARLANESHQVYVRHGVNTWSFTHGGEDWERRPTPSWMPAQDLARYRDYARWVIGVDWPEPSEVSSPRGPTPLRDQPLVSCVMPTANRRPFVARAIHYFMNQGWPRRELVILDDGTDSVADLIPDDPRIRYVRERPPAKPVAIGRKRNRACELAEGEIIVHWDDDDWYATWRLDYQVSSLLEAGAQLCGVDNLCYLDPWTGRGWRYVYDGSARWLAGGSLCYRRELWERLRFRDELRVGEDNDFVARSGDAPLLRLDETSFYVGLIHPHNTSHKQTEDRRWRSVPAVMLHAMLGADLDFYRALGTDHPDAQPG